MNSSPPRPSEKTQKSSIAAYTLNVRFIRERHQRESAAITDYRLIETFTMKLEELIAELDRNSIKNIFDGRCVPRSWELTRSIHLARLVEKREELFAV